MGSNTKKYLLQFTLGVNAAKRAVALSEVTRVQIQITGEEWEIEVRGNKYMAFQFCLGNQFNRVTGDGRHVTVIQIRAEYVSLSTYYWNKVPVEQLIQLRIQLTMHIYFGVVLTELV